MRGHSNFFSVPFDVAVMVAQSLGRFFAHHTAESGGTQFCDDFLEWVLACQQTAFNPIVGGVGQLMEKHRFLIGGQGNFLSG